MSEIIDKLKKERNRRIRISDQHGDLKNSCIGNYYYAQGIQFAIDLLLKGERNYDKRSMDNQVNR